MLQVYSLREFYLHDLDHKSPKQKAVMLGSGSYIQSFADYEADSPEQAIWYYHQGVEHSHPDIKKAWNKKRHEYDTALVKRIFADTRLSSNPDVDLSWTGKLPADKKAENPYVPLNMLKEAIDQDQRFSAHTNYLEDTIEFGPYKGICYLHYILLQPNGIRFLRKHSSVVTTEALKLILKYGFDKKREHVFLPWIPLYPASVTLPNTAWKYLDSLNIAGFSQMKEERLKEMASRDTKTTTKIKQNKNSSAETKTTYHPKEDACLVSMTRSLTKPITELMQDFLDEKENADTLLLNRFFYHLKHDHEIMKAQIDRLKNELAQSQEKPVLKLTLLAMCYDACAQIRLAIEHYKMAAA